MNSFLRSLCLLLLGLALSSCTTLSRSKGQPGLTETEFSSYDGKKMPWKHWPVPTGQRTQGVVIAIHGLSGAASDFWLLGQELPKYGVAVYAYELRGQGNDSDKAMRGDILSAREWQRDLVTFHRLVRARHKKLPITWYGESLGSLIALHTIAAERGKDEPDALIMSAPIAGLRMQLTDLQHFLLTASSHLAPFLKVSLGGLAGVDESKLRVTSGTTHGEQMQHTPHHVEAFSLRLLREISSMLDENPAAAPKARLPVLMLASPHDIVASPDQIQGLFSQIGSRQKKLLWYTRSYHLLLHDVQRDQVVKDVRRFLPKQ